MAFPFEHLAIYEKTLNWIDHSESLTEDPEKKLSRTVVDQLSRVSLSIALNLAEGNGRWHKAEKRGFFWIARGSVFECVGIVQVLHKRHRISEAE